MCQDKTILKNENIWTLITICQNVAFSGDCIIMGILVSKRIAFVYVSISGKMYILSYTYTIQCNNAYIFGECIQLILNIDNWHSVEF